MSLSFIKFTETKLDVDVICYLDSINDTSISYIEGVHHKNKDNGLKYGFAHVLEGEPHK